VLKKEGKEGKKLQMRDKNQKICAELLHFRDLFDIIIGIKQSQPTKERDFYYE
jgi:hypothetical protein